MTDPRITPRLERLSCGSVWASYPGLPVTGLGETEQEAIDAFWEMFEVQWAALADCPVERLTEGAFLARQRLLAVATSKQRRAGFITTLRSEGRGLPGVR